MSPAPQQQSRHRLYGVALVLLTLIAYLPVLGAGYIWDDNWHVTDNPCLGSLGGLRQIWLQPSRPGEITIPQYYPLTHTTFWIEHQLWGDRPLGYHLDNVLIHAGSALLLWRLLVRLEIPGAWFAAALWAVHPVNVESVAWVTERKNTLSVLFYLSAMTAYLRFDREPERRDWRLYFLALALFFCALWSKTVSSTLPAAILLIIWWKRGRISVRDVARLVPFFAAGAAMGSVTSWMERNVVGAVGPEWSFSPLDRLLIAGRAAWFYAAKLLFPFALSFNYERWEIDPAAWWQWLFPITAIAAVVTLFALRSRIGRGPLVAVLFFLGTLAPALGFFDVYPMRYAFVADHFQYLASAGVIALATAAVRHYTRPKTRRQRKVPAIPAIPTVFLLTFALLTYARAGVFRSAKSLWLDTLAKNPTSWMANQNYGNLLLDQGKVDEAERHFARAAELKADHVESRLRLAAIAGMRNRSDETEKWLREAIRVQRPYPQGTAFYRTAAIPHVRLAIFLAEHGRPDEAIAEYETALSYAPGDAVAVTNLANLHGRLGAALFRDGKHAEAIARFRLAVEVNPNSAEARANLDKALSVRQTPPP